MQSISEKTKWNLSTTLFAAPLIFPRLLWPRTYDYSLGKSVKLIWVLILDIYFTIALGKRIL